MAANRSLTTVNTVLTLIATNPWANTTAADALGVGSTVTGFVSPLVGVPLQLTGITSDNPFDISQQTLVETQTSLEGHLYAGYLAGANIVELNISFMAASDSLATLQTLAKIMQMQRETMKFSGTMNLPSQKKTYALNNGYWINWKAIPTHARVLQPVPCQFRFESVDQTSEV